MYARGVLGALILIAAAFFLLNIAIAGGIFAFFALIVLLILLKEGLF